MASIAQHPETCIARFFLKSDLIKSLCLRFSHSDRRLSSGKEILCMLPWSDRLASVHWKMALGVRPVSVSGTSPVVGQVDWDHA
jgi:hypothetical protein